MLLQLLQVKNLSIEPGCQAVKATVEAYKGDKLPEIIDDPFKWYDKSNLDTPEIKAILYD